MLSKNHKRDFKMNKDFIHREYINFDPKQGWPTGTDLFYECSQCGKELSSMEDSDCLCHNLYVDASAGRIGANDLSKIRLFRITKSS